MTFEEWATREGLDVRKGTESNPNDYRDRATHFAFVAYQAALEQAAQIADDMDYGLGDIAAAVRALKG